MMMIYPVGKYMDYLFLDTETRSDVDIKKCGAAVYTAAASIDILSCEYVSGTARVKHSFIFPQDKKRCKDFLEECKDALWIAHNASFDRWIIERCLGIEHKAWGCTMAMAHALNLPGALQNLSQYLLGESKHESGYEVMKTNARRVQGELMQREDIKELTEYCERDVELCRKVFYFLRDKIGELASEYYIDQLINRRGVPINTGLCERARDDVDRINQACDTIVTEHTGIDKATMRARLGAWMQNQGARFNKSSTKLSVINLQALLKQLKIDDDVKKELANAIGFANTTSTSKWQAALHRTNDDDRLRDAFMLQNTAHGRWTSYGVQLHNFPRAPKDKPLDLTWTHTWQHEQLSTCLRAMVQAKCGKKLIIADWSQIELRILFYLAGETEALAQIQEGVDPYKMLAAKIFRKEYNQIDKAERNVGKSAVLGLGYGMGAAKFAAMNNVTQSMANRCVHAYHNEYPGVRKLWHKLGWEEGGDYWWWDKEIIAGKKALVLGLPSGRSIHLWEAERKDDMVNANILGRRYTLSPPTLVEYLVSGTARDILMRALRNCYDAGLNVVLHLHDEVVLEELEENATEQEKKLRQIMQPKKIFNMKIPLEVESRIADCWL